MIFLLKHPIETPRVPRAFRELITRHLRDTLHTSQKMCVPGDEPAHHPFGSGGCAPPHFQGRFRCPVGVWVGSFVFRSFASCVFACAWRADGDGQRVFDPTSLPVGLALVLVGLAAVLVAPAALPPGLLTVLASLAAVLASKKTAGLRVCGNSTPRGFLRVCEFLLFLKK